MHPKPLSCPSTRNYGLGLEGESWTRTLLLFFENPTFFSYHYPTSCAQFWQILLPRDSQIPNPASFLLKYRILRLPFQTLYGKLECEIYYTLSSVSCRCTKRSWSCSLSWTKPLVTMYFLWLPHPWLDTVTPYLTGQWKLLLFLTLKSPELLINPLLLMPFFTPFPF